MTAGHDPNGDVVISVVDSGPGIPAQDRERVIERFVRLEQSRSEPGSGLGLSLASAVAEAHSGKLVLDDGNGPPGKPGLKASLVLPAA
jgi:signal transduction histidine kinase